MPIKFEKAIRKVTKETTTEAMKMALGIPVDKLYRAPNTSRASTTPEGNLSFTRVPYGYPKEDDEAVNVMYVDEHDRERILEAFDILEKESVEISVHYRPEWPLRKPTGGLKDPNAGFCNCTVPRHRYRINGFMHKVKLVGPSNLELEWCSVTCPRNGCSDPMVEVFLPVNDGKSMVVFCIVPRKMERCVISLLYLERFHPKVLRRTKASHGYLPRSLGTSSC